MTLKYNSKYKTYHVGKRSNEEAFELAKEYRQNMDKKLNLNPQQYL